MSKYKYCLDSNFLMTLSNDCYSFNICPSFWDCLLKLARSKIIYIPELVFDEITATPNDDNKKKDNSVTSLSKWVKKNKSTLVLYIDNQVQMKFKEIIQNEAVQKIADNARARSGADAWLIAYSLQYNSKIVTNDTKLIGILGTYKIENLWVKEFMLKNKIMLTASMEYVKPDDELFNDNV